MEPVKAPWTDEQVANLNAWQHTGHVHPFTCERCRDELGTRFIRHGDELLPIDITAVDPERLLIADPRDMVILERQLVATNDGWICETCDYTQDWAFDRMLEPPPASPFAGLLGQ